MCGGGPLEQPSQIWPLIRRVFEGDLRRIFDCQFHLLGFLSEVSHGDGGGAENNGISPFQSWRPQV